jgi:hypothetical protein
MKSRVEIPQFDYGEAIETTNWSIGGFGHDEKCIF